MYVNSPAYVMTLHSSFSQLRDNSDEVLGIFTAFNHDFSFTCLLGHMVNFISSVNQAVAVVPTVLDSTNSTTAYGSCSATESQLTSQSEPKRTWHSQQKQFLDVNCKTECQK